MSSVNVTVETSTDNQIIEVSYDGHETVQPPLTLSEHLAKQATKINFDEVDAEDEEGANGEANSGDPAGMATIEPSLFITTATYLEGARGVSMTTTVHSVK